MTTWITRFGDPAGVRPRVAVKDAFDVAGTVTTAGCVAVRSRAVPAAADAACLAGFRAAGAVLVGKTTLTELCVSPFGDNPEFGTAVNPLAPDRIAGGSSSGSAVAVAAGEADLGLGTDTGGSVRIPAACCGIVGLKPTWGRVPTAGVWPLAPSLDHVGVLARDVAGAIGGLRLLDPGWQPASPPSRTVGRLRLPGVDPAVEQAVDAALEVAGLTVHPVELAGWDRFWEPLDAIMVGEFWRAHPDLLDADGVGEFANGGLRAGQAVTAGQLAGARAGRSAWRRDVTALIAPVGVLVLPTLVGPPPPAGTVEGFPITALTAPFNLAGTPALALPVPAPGAAVPVSMQLVAAPGAEGLLCATAQAIEAALR